MVELDNRQGVAKRIYSVSQQKSHIGIQSKIRMHNAYVLQSFNYCVPIYQAPLSISLANQRIVLQVHNTNKTCAERSREKLVFSDVTPRLV